jgi:acylphosphatase
VAEHAPSDPKAVHVRILGRVQRVGFRYWTIDEASHRGLDGWVRNRRDGTVEAVFIGPAQEVDDMLTACGNGPPAALVNCVLQSDLDDEQRSALTGEGFSTRQTE